MDNILYYPHINLPRTDWTLRALLYYVNVGSIVPQEYFYDPANNYDPFMLELVRAELVTPIDPMAVLERPWEVKEPFLQLIESNKSGYEQAQKKFRSNSHVFLHGGKQDNAKIHADKFDDSIFSSLQEMGLAKRIDHHWFSVEKRTAEVLMRYLVTVLAAKTDRLPTTDSLKPIAYRDSYDLRQKKRETILRDLMPFPKALDLKKLKRFKEKQHELLHDFRNKIELLVLDPNVLEGTPLFESNMYELHKRKEELVARMNESKFETILFGTVCGLVSAAHGLATASGTEAVVGGIPGFVGAVYSALKIERAEKVFDQSGMKYLALAEKRLYKK